MTRRLESVLAGVGESDYSSRSGRTVMDLAVDAILAACRDAELDPRDLDGIITYPNSVDAEEIVSTLGLRGLTFTSVVHMGGASAVASLKHAALAVESGSARNVLVLRARNGSSAGKVHQRPSLLPSQLFRTQLEHPYGWNTPAQRYAMICRRYMHEYGLAREQLASVALSASRHAQLNPRAQNRGRPLTWERYAAGRMIADPYTRFDCCLESDGACAVVVTSMVDAAPRDLHARLLAVEEGRPESPDDLTNRSDFLSIGLESAARAAWEGTGLGPADMDAAMVYDCFTFEVVHQLEAAGFAAPGKGGEFCADGSIDLGGRLPVNPHGGLLAEAHMSGLNHVVEAVRQLRQECGARQVTGARHIAVTGWGDLGDGAIAVLERAERPGPRRASAAPR